METCGDAYQPDALTRWVCDQEPGHRTPHDGPATAWYRDEGKPGRASWNSLPDQPAPHDEITLKPGDDVTITRMGRPCRLIVDRITPDGAVLRGLTPAEAAGGPFRPRDLWP